MSSYTELGIEGQSAWKSDGILPAGEFIIEILPVVQRKDGYLAVKLNSCPNYQWVINLMIINKYYTFL